MRVTSGLIAALLLMACGTALALPQAFFARYEVTHSGLTLGEARINYQQIGSDRYRYSSHTRPLGIAALLLRSEVREVSQGRITDAGFQPARYQYERTGRNARTANLAFDWEEMEVINTISGDPWKMTIPADTLDRMVSQLQLMYDLAHQEQDLSYPIADGGKIKRYTLRITGRETLQTPLGQFEALKIVRLTDNDRRSTTFWCAPALNYLPIRVEHQEKGDNFTMNLRNLEGFPAAVASSAPPANPTPAVVAMTP